MVTGGIRTTAVGVQYDPEHNTAYIFVLHAKQLLVLVSLRLGVWRSDYWYDFGSNRGDCVRPIVRVVFIFSVSPTGSPLVLFVQGVGEIVSETLCNLFT